MTSPQPAGVELHLGALGGAVRRRLETWEEEGFGSRLWARDANLWPHEDAGEIRDRLGWLDLPHTMASELAGLRAFADKAKQEGLRKVLLLGMGGSSLAPELFERTFGSGLDPTVRVMDSTHPDFVRSVRDQIDLDSTLFFVASKSGTTIETLSLFRYFWHEVESAGLDAGRHFSAITDPGSSLARMARERGFRAVLEAPANVGGRFSALTPFGLAPAVWSGVDLESLLAGARSMAEDCGPTVEEHLNPGLVLGAALGEMARLGRDKLTLVTTKGLEGFPDWVEQLVAESTGKNGKGIIPITSQPLPEPGSCGTDRLFVLIGLESDEERALRHRLRRLEEAGHPWISVRLNSPNDLGGEFFRWEVAVVAAGAVLGIQPFDQPDVQLAKTMAARAMSSDTGLGGSTEVSGPDGLEAIPIDCEDHLRRTLSDWIGSGRDGDYVALQAFIEPSTSSALVGLRERLAARSGLAVTLGIGPRFLHSTGQVHKGGPGSGLFLQLIDRPRERVPIPETELDFNRLVAAQALGDAAALAQRGRRILRVDLGDDPLGGIEILVRAVQGA